MPIFFCCYKLKREINTSTNIAFRRGIVRYKINKSHHILLVRNVLPIFPTFFGLFNISSWIISSLEGEIGSSCSTLLFLFFHLWSQFSSDILKKHLLFCCCNWFQPIKLTIENTFNFLFLFQLTYDGQFRKLVCYEHLALKLIPLHTFLTRLLLSRINLNKSIMKFQS